MYADKPINPWLDESTEPILKLCPLFVRESKTDHQRYINIFKDLKSVMQGEKIHVFCSPTFGCTTKFPTYWQPKGFIYISWKLPMKEKVFAFAHEIGHLFYVKPIRKLGRLVARKTMHKSESVANKTAKKILFYEFQKNMDEEYDQFYNKLSARLNLLL